MVQRLRLWPEFLTLAYWWLDAMVLVLFLFTMMLFIAEPVLASLARTLVERLTRGWMCRRESQRPAFSGRPFKNHEDARLRLLLDCAERAQRLRRAFVTERRGWRGLYDFDITWGLTNCWCCHGGHLAHHRAVRRGVDRKV